MNRDKLSLLILTVWEIGAFVKVVNAKISDPSFILT